MQHQCILVKTVFEPAEEGGLTAYIPSLPGCVSEGDTFEETVENIKGLQCSAVNYYLFRFLRISEMGQKRGVVIGNAMLTVCIYSLTKGCCWNHCPDEEGIETNEAQRSKGTKCWN